MSRKSVQKFLEKIQVEVAIIAVVILYAFLIFATLIFDENDAYYPHMKDFFIWADMAFLSVFIVEILIKCYAYSLQFAKDPYNVLTHSL